MRCYLVHIHGRLNWLVEQPAFRFPQIDARPAGFFCHRYVLASNVRFASERAFGMVRTNLDRQTCWLSDDEAELELEAEKVEPENILKAFVPPNRGHTFYRGG